MMRVREIIFPTISEYIIFGNLHVYTCPYTHVTTINENKSHEFDRNKGRVYGRRMKQKR